MNIALIVIFLAALMLGDGARKNEKGKRNTRVIAVATAVIAIFWVMGIPFAPLAVAAGSGVVAGLWLLKKDGWFILLSVGAVIYALSLVS
ncbi:hypothetical protein [Actinomadura coerulea]|uniref:hypothetical protein n=1 Tax=Actinomadura coerulea TaxID=46159 RepID=UPI00343C478C